MFMEVENVGIVEKSIALIALRSMKNCRLVVPQTSHGKTSGRWLIRATER